MASTYPVGAVEAPPSPVVARDRGRFFVVYAWICLAVAFGGFVPSFWYPLASTGFGGTWLVVFHGVMFTGWAVLFLTQTLRVERGRLVDHRAWGVAGVSLASMLLLLGIATAVGALEARLAAGFGDKARAFTIVPISSIAMFFGFFVAAVANVHRPDWHKRLMMIATAASLLAAFARFFFVLVDGRAFGATAATSPPGIPEVALRPAAAVLTLLVGAALVDRRRRGGMHPAWYWGIGIYATISITRVPLSRTQAWYAFADWLVAFG